MNYNASQLVNFEVINDMILGKTEKKMKRKRKAGWGVISIIHEPEFKLYRMSFSRGGDYTTIRQCRLGINT